MSSKIGKCLNKYNNHLWVSGNAAQCFQECAQREGCAGFTFAAMGFCALVMDLNACDDSLLYAFDGVVATLFTMLGKTINIWFKDILSFNRNRS